jgi:transcriptional regulator with XRE-family HTH domain
MTRKKPNYLRSFRKRNGLTQGEMAFLLGCNNPARVSDYERMRRHPSAEIMIRCQAIFGEPVEKLFPVLSEKVEKETKKRARELRDKIGEGNESASAKRKLDFLNDIRGRRGEESDILPWEKKTLMAS